MSTRFVLWKASGNVHIYWVQTNIFKCVYSPVLTTIASWQRAFSKKWENRIGMIWQGKELRIPTLACGSLIIESKSSTEIFCSFGHSNSLAQHLKHRLLLFSCQVLSDSMDCSMSGSMRFSKQEYWNVLPFPSPGDLPKPRIEPVSLALAGRFFTTEPPREPFRHTCTLAQ